MDDPTTSASEGFGLMFYNARWYDPALGRFAQADSIVPPGAQGLDRYAYANNNALSYIDPDGHFAIPVAVIVAVVVITKVIDYGWTAYDAWQSTQTLNNPVATDAEKAFAAANLAMTAAFEAAEPDDALPVSLPLDDLARHGVLKLGDEVVEHGDEIIKAPVIIGENMKRVSDFANKNGGVTINDFIPSSEWSLEKNTDWIKQMVDEGREIIDIGPHFNRRLDDLEAGRDPYRLAYNLERMITKGYENYRKVFDRLGKWRGGVPGFE